MGVGAKAPTPIFLALWALWAEQASRPWPQLFYLVAQSRCFFKIVVFYGGLATLASIVVLGGTSDTKVRIEHCYYL